jgi:hypothetical protein
MRTSAVSALGTLALLIIPAAQLTPPAAAREQVTGSGTAKEDRRKLGGFDEVELSAAVTAKIEVGGLGSEIVVTGDDNLVPLVHTVVKGNRLLVNADKGLHPRAGLQVTVRMPALRGLQVTGAGRASVTGIAGDDLQLAASGASRVDVAGRVRRLRVGVSGASRVSAGTLETESAELAVSGASRLELRSKNAVKGDASGASSVEIQGNPPNVNVSNSGASSVKKS